MKLPHYRKFLLISTLISISVFGQNKLVSSVFIPKNLKDNANAVVRLDETIVTIEHDDSMTINGKRIITVLNKTGNANIRGQFSYDNHQKIMALQATIYNAFGKKIKKFSKSKFQDYSATSGSTMASDNRYKHLEYTSSSYPYTVVLEYELKTNTTGFINKWFPIEDFYVSVEKNTYTIYNPKKIKLRTKEKNFKGFPIKITKTEDKITYQLTEQPAFTYENYCPNLSKIFPNVLFGLNHFSLMGETGIAKNWKEFGKWQYDLLIKEKNNLSEETKSKIQKLTETLTDTIEKAKYIYDYVQNKTRYISIQYGIGGLSPAYSNDVDQLGYGDCKGLTNYTKSLLEAVGITSYYTEIYAKKDKRNIEKDFHSIQGDHIILNIPYKGKNLWLECTSQTMPFGFLGDFTDDRDALVLTPDGGIIKHTPVYKNEDNLQFSKGTISIDSKGNIHSDLEITTTGIQYDNRYHIENFDSREIIEYYKSNYWQKINNLNIENYSFTNNKEKVSFKENLELDIHSYASFAGDNLLLSVNVFNKFSKLAPKRRTRKLPIEIQRGFKDSDLFTFSVPKDYSISTLPKEKIISNEFGIYKVSFYKIDEQHFQYKRNLLIKAGLYPKASYDQYRDFLKSITKYDNLRIAFTKKQS